MFTKILKPQLDLVLYMIVSTAGYAYLPFFSHFMLTRIILWFIDNTHCLEVVGKAYGMGAVAH
jgi:hypothetical protein